MIKLKVVETRLSS